MWYEIPGWPGYRINHRREVMSLHGESPQILKPGDSVRLHRDGKYTKCQVIDLMKLAGISIPLPELQVAPHHEAARDRCDQGHEFTPENTMHRKGRNGNTIRKCKRCHADAMARWRAKKKKFRDSVG
jgi:hypothetical protein